MKKFKLFVILSLVIGALLAFCACGKERISAPLNVDVTAEDQLTWAEVDNARSYVVEIIDQNGKIQTFEPKKTEVSLSNLKQGEYEIKVKAVSGFSNYKDSIWTEPLYFEKGYDSGCIYKLINNNTEFSVSKYGKAGAEVYIKEEYRKKPVTEIADKAFRGYSNIETVYIGNNVRRIGEGAFQNCKNLVKIVLPENGALTEIGSSAFQSCNNLKEINIPTSITVIEDYTFAYCRSLLEVNIHENIKEIGDYAFSDCSSLTKVEIPDTVETLGQAAFTGATSLTEVKIGANITAIGTETFNMCVALETLTFSTAGKLESIGDSAFKESKSLTTLHIPEGVKTIGDYAFCVSPKTEKDQDGNEKEIYESTLSDITLPSTVTRVGSSAFRGTKYYTDALSGADQVYLNNWLLGVSDDFKAELKKVDASVLQTGTVGISDMVFYGSPKLSQVTLPTSVKYVGQWSFAANAELQTVTMSDVVLVDAYAFTGNENMYSVKFGKKLENIGSYAFKGCAGLNINYLELPETLVSIGTQAFDNTMSTSGSSTEVLYAGNKDDGWWVVGYKGNVSKVTLKDNTIGIADYAFYLCETLTWIENMESLQYIGTAAFYGCSKLEYVGGLRLSSVTELKEYAFASCASLYSIDLPANLKSVGRSAFSNCRELTEINLAKATMNVTEIGNYAFYQCINLKTAQLGKKLTYLGKYAFYKCLALEEISLPDSLTKIEERTFYKCEALSSVAFGKNVDSIGNYAFTGCVALTRIKFPTALTKINKYAFFGCEELAYITFNENLQTIGDYAFHGDTKILSLELPTSLNTIGRYAFKYCTGLKSLLLRSDVETVGMHAFYACNALTLYTDATDSLKGWDKYFNSSYKGVVYGCTLSADGTYVVSVTITEKTLQHVETATFGGPESYAYIFMGWALTEGGEVAYTAETIKDAPIGTTLYAIWSE